MTIARDVTDEDYHDADLVLEILGRYLSGETGESIRETLNLSTWFVGNVVHDKFLICKNPECGKKFYPTGSKKRPTRFGDRECFNAWQKYAMGRED